jgi:hypothetical protein
MSRDLDPCNCEQACEYARLLKLVLSMPVVTLALTQEIERTLDAYEVAADEYKGEG